MRIILCGLLMSIFYCSAIAQNNIEINAGIYVEAQNYGGEKELKRFLLQEMSYPSVALLSKTEGTVEVASIVNNKTGVPSKIHIK
mgnify:FL=1